MSATAFFPKPLRIEELDGDKHKLLEQFDFVVAGITISVPEGFITDYASVPRPLWALASPNDYKRAAVAHDFLYARGATTQLIADAIFQWLLTREGCPTWKAWVMYYSLRLFGFKAWNDHRKKKE